MDTQTFGSEPQLDQYKSISAIAVLSFILGILSVAALFHPLLWFIPAIGAIVGIISLIRLRLLSEQLSGRFVAVMGLLLSLFFLGFAPARHFSARRIMEVRSIEYCSDWLHYVLEGELEKAHQGHEVYTSRQPEGTALKEFYESSVVMKQKLDEFFGADLLRQLQRFSAASKITHLKTLDVFFGNDFIAAVHLFEISEGEYSLRLNLEAERVQPGQDVYWSIAKIYAEGEITNESSDTR